MDFQAILNAGGSLGEAKAVNGGAVPYAVIPEGAAVEDLERLLPAPVRARAEVTAKSEATFSAYVNRFKGENTSIFADQQAFSLVGVIDYHGPTAAAWCDHRVSYSAPRSLEWQTWRTSSGKRMAQPDFAQFIEDNVVDIRSPAGADVLEVARSLQAKKAVEFVSAIRLADGSQQFTYNETVDGSAAKGTLKIPEEFKLGIPVFFGGESYEVTARLRYRIAEGKLQMWYELYRPEHIEQDAFGHVCAGVAEATAITIWEGAL